VNQKYTFKEYKLGHCPHRKRPGGECFIMIGTEVNVEHESLDFELL